MTVEPDLLARQLAQAGDPDAAAAVAEADAEHHRSEAAAQAGAARIAERERRDAERVRELRFARQSPTYFPGPGSPSYWVDQAIVSLAQRQRIAQVDAGVAHLLNPEGLPWQLASSPAFRGHEMSASAAEARLARHAEWAKAERRDLASDSDTAGADFAAAGLPNHLGEQFAAGLRAAATIAPILVNAELPPTGDVVRIPRFATGAAAAAQAADLANMQETDATTDTVSSAVATIAAMQDLSLQLFERAAPAMDLALSYELGEAVGQELDRQLVHGSGSSGELEGLAVASGTNGVTYTATTPAVAELVAKIGQGAAAIASTLKRPATHVVMHGRRSAWIAALAGSLAGVTFDPEGRLRILGLQVVDSQSIVTTAGAGTNQDAVLVLHAPELFLFAGQTTFHVDAQGIGSTLQIRAHARRYAALIPRRREAVAVITGTGLASPTFA